MQKYISRLQETFNIHNFKKYCVKYYIDFFFGEKTINDIANANLLVCCF